MIAIIECARRIKKFLEEKGEDKFKIFVRLQMQLDVFVFSNRPEEAKLYYAEFIDNLRKTENLSRNNYEITFDVVAPEEMDDPYYASVALDLGQKIDYGPRYSQNSLISLPDARNLNENLPPVVTFYSYKGGMGRTTTLVSYALDLSYNHKKKVVIVDCDLEAPGYLNFFNLYKRYDLQRAKKNGFVEFVCDSRFYDDDINIEDYVVDVKENPQGEKHAFEDEEKPESWLQPDDGDIWIVPAGNLNEGCLDKNILEEGEIIEWEHRNDYLEGLGKLNSIDSQFLKSSFLKLFEKLNDKFHPDVILVDSRTGFNDIFGTLAFNLSSCVVGFFGKNRQTEPGFINLLTTHLKMKEKAKLNNEKFLKLQLVYSILPKGDNGASPRMKDLISQLYPVNPPDSSSLHRCDLLDRIGRDDAIAENDYRKEIRNLSLSSELEDYRELFENINKAVFETEYEQTPITASEGRMNVLLHLRNVLAGVENFAESSPQIDASKFFYRACMKDLFLPEKFIIQGYKGTGKTCLYKALANKEISETMRKWAQDDSNCERIFLQVLPDRDAELPFKTINFAMVRDPEFYFRSLWKFITWNKLLFDDGREELTDVRKKVCQASALREFVHSISGSKTQTLFEKFLKRENPIQDLDHDLEYFDKELCSENKSLFILYDRLDSFIPSLKWNKAVSPLIEYWRDFHSQYKSVVPKVFIRTDLLKQTEGVNTARLTNNIINIEWDIAEVFAYFFKLIFSDEKIGQVFWDFSAQLGMQKQYIDSIKKNFDKNLNQFRSLNEAEMVPVVHAFFGKEVVYDGKSYGKPWGYFENEMANADRGSISLRPFVNLMKESMERVDYTEPTAGSEILNSSIYASDEVRFDTTNMYFGDIVKDPTAIDLEKLKEVVEETPKYRFKSLHEGLFRELITEVYERIQGKGVDRVVENQEKLKALIFANGIMAKRDTSRGVFYAYAPIFCFGWRLRDSFAESEETDVRRGDTSKSEMKDRLVGILKLNPSQQPYVSVTIGQGNEQREFRYAIQGKIPMGCEIGDVVSFKINEVPHKFKANAVYRIAVGLQRVDQNILNEKSYSTMVVLNEWAVQNNVKASVVVELLRANGVNAENPLSKVYRRDLRKIRKDLLTPVVIKNWADNRGLVVDKVVASLRSYGVEVVDGLSRAYPDDLKLVEEELLNSKKNTQKMKAIPKQNVLEDEVVVNNWATARGVAANEVVEMLRSNGVRVKNGASLVSLDDLAPVEKKIVAEKKITKGLSVVPKLYDISDSNVPNDLDENQPEGFWSRVWKAIKEFLY